MQALLKNSLLSNFISCLFFNDCIFLLECVIIKYLVRPPKVKVLLWDKENKIKSLHLRQASISICTAGALQGHFRGRVAVELVQFSIEHHSFRVCSKSVKQQVRLSNRRWVKERLVRLSPLRPLIRMTVCWCLTVRVFTARVKNACAVTAPGTSSLSADLLRTKCVEAIWLL